ncbi:MAG: holo-[acyl-carrier-protein] synthase [Thaumarchaeota archaeon]|nr:MAG: holo-[acyl-carrier-protein] synthase [Nitrososphaerota archaeon]
MLEKLSIGTDIVKINRFRKLPYIKNKKFYNKIFTKSEITYCIKYKDPYPHFAVRFAGKEAVIKSIKNKIEMKDIEISHKKSKPFIKILKKNSFMFHISLSHDGEYAIAMIISEKKLN